MEIYAFNTKVRTGIVGLRTLINGTPRALEMERFQFIDLFPSKYLSPNLRELVPHLPLFGVGYLDGIVVTQFSKLDSMKDAVDCVANICSIQQQDDDDESFTTAAPTPSAKKKLNFKGDSSKIGPDDKAKNPATDKEGQTSESEMDEREDNEEQLANKQPSDKENVEQENEDDAVELMNKLGVKTPTK